MLTIALTLFVFVAAVFGLSLGALLAGRRLRGTCGAADGACACARPCPRRAARAAAGDAP